MYASVVRFAESNIPKIPGVPHRVLPRRIHRLEYRHDGKPYVATVGKPEGRMVGTNEVTFVEDFEAE